jgi:guanylate kinase
MRQQTPARPDQGRLFVLSGPSGVGKGSLLKALIAQIVRSRAPDAVMVFIQPPTLASLEDRLRKRGADSEERIAERLRIAQAELSCLPLYHYTVVNDDFNDALDQLRAIVIAERCRVPHIVAP